MARSTIGADATVRKHVLALRCEHRMLLTDTLLGDSVDWGEYAYIELTFDEVQYNVRSREGPGR